MRRRHVLGLVGSAAAGLAPFRAGPALAGPGVAAPAPPGFRITLFDAAPVRGARDITHAGDGTFWFCGQSSGTVGRLDPRDGSIRVVGLGEDAVPHGVVVGPDGAAWITDSGQNAIARVDAKDHRVRLWRLPADRADADLNTGVFDRRGLYWFTGQSGIIGRFDPRAERMQVWDAPRGRGPYGITATPQGTVWYVSLAGNYLALIEDPDAGRVRVVDPPTPNQGARRVWSDSRGRLWISEWNSGNVSVHDPADGSWRVWRLPGERPRAYAVYVDERDMVWLSDFPGNAIHRFDPRTESFVTFPADRPSANVRQLDGRPGEVWGGETGTNRLIRIETTA